MNPMAVAFITENAVAALVIAAGWSLLRQGGGLQAKTPPVPKKEPAPKRGAKTETPPAPEAETAPIAAARTAA